MNVLVIGAGANGLSATKECIHKGLKVICVERKSHVGGLWKYNSDPKVTTVWKNLEANLPSEIMMYSDFPKLPNHVFCSGQAYQKYLEDYATYFDLRRHIRFNTEVKNVNKLKNGEFEAMIGDDKMTFRSVIVASGLNATPNLPHIPRSEFFSGKVIHGRQFKDPDVYSKPGRAIVVGWGSSSVDFVIELASRGWDVHISSSSSIIASPLTVFHPLFYSLRNSYAAYFIPEFIVKLLIALQMYFSGYTSPDFDIENYRSSPLKRVKYREYLESCTINPRLLSFTSNGVVFTDHSELTSVDLVIFATGYKPCFSFLNEEIRPSIPLKLYKNLFSDIENLFFVGFFRCWCSTIPIAELQNRVIAGLLTGKSKPLPSLEEQRKWIESRGQKCSKMPNQSQTNSKYNWLMFPEYSAELAMFLEKEITLPTFEMFWKAPITTFLVATQVCTGAGVRLLGDSSTKSSFRIVLNQLQCPSIIIWIIIYPISLIICYLMKPQYLRLLLVSPVAWAVYYIILSWI